MDRQKPDATRKRMFVYDPESGTGREKERQIYHVSHLRFCAFQWFQIAKLYLGSHLDFLVSQSFQNAAILNMSKLYSPVFGG